MENKIKILVIEDEKTLLNYISKNLELSGYRVLKALTGEEGLLLAMSQNPDVILLDLGLPDMDGCDVIKKVRKVKGTPILVVSARTEEQEKVKILDAGADDYITKPFGNSELQARIRTCIRHGMQMQKENGYIKQQYAAEGLVIDYERRIVTVDGEQIHLTPVEYKIVQYLSQNAGRVVTYSSLLAEVWGPYVENDNKILRVNMANIRRKLEKEPAQPRYIFTEMGVGYRMLDEG